MDFLIITKQRSAFTISSIYVSAVVGAGFATGQEIYSFFTRYGVLGFLGIFISTAILCICGVLILRKSLAYDLKTPFEMTEFKFGEKGASIIRALSVFLQFSVFIVMIAGLRTIIGKLGLSPVLSALLVVIGIFFVISSDMTRIIKFNSTLAPVVIIGITLTCIILLSLTLPEDLLSIIRQSPPLQSNSTSTGFPFGFIISAILYGFFNVLLAAPALCACSDITGSSKKSILGGLIGGLLIGIMAFLSHTVIYSNSIAIEMPIVTLAEQHLGIIGNLYQIVIFAAMAGSAVICGKCTVEMMPSKKSWKILKALIVCAAAVPLSLLDFSGLIGVLYPFLGGIGILAMIMMLW